MIEIIKYPKRKNWPEILKRPVQDTDSLEKTVQAILSKVKSKGDKALRKYSKDFDAVDLEDFSVPDIEISQAGESVSAELKAAIQQAKNNIEKFHSAQLQTKRIIETQPGIQCWRKHVAIEKVGLYIPGGTAPLFSTILMLGIPAKLAGCKEIILCTPPVSLTNREGDQVILYTAGLAGITKIFRVGGAQAIA